ncbi:MAG: DEAD/DEAH box helicase [Nitrospiraceae bacterium]
MSMSAASSFASFGLSNALLRDLTTAGFTIPTPIQAEAIPAVLQGRDVLGCAQTGTGKTAAFVVPMIERLADGPQGHPQGLILVPTRELAFQIQETVDQLGRSRRVFAAPLVGGSDMQAQIRGLRQHPDIIVATPGRLLDHMWNGTIHLTHLRIVVLDEADRMLEMGFAPQLNQILEALPEERQTLLFSATLANLHDLTRISLKNPVHATVAKSATTAEGVTDQLHHTTTEDKTPLLLSLLNDREESVLVFTRTKHRAERLGLKLEQVGHRVAILHGDRRLSQRRTALEGFRRGRYRILVATDIAARGLDVANIGHVINYDLPNTAEDYVHRIGRTARNKMVGRATSLVTVEDAQQIRAIETLLGRSVPHAPGSLQPSRPQPIHAESPQRPRVGQDNRRSHRSDGTRAGRHWERSRPNASSGEPR